MAERSKAPESGVDLKIPINLVRKGEGSNPSVVIFFPLFRGDGSVANELKVHGSMHFDLSFAPAKRSYRQACARESKVRVVGKLSIPCVHPQGLI
jgi:hypothetical protein